MVASHCAIGAPNVADDLVGSRSLLSQHVADVFQCEKDRRRCGLLLLYSYEVDKRVQAIRRSCNMAERCRTSYGLERSGLAGHRQRKPGRLVQRRAAERDVALGHRECSTIYRR